MQICNNSQLFKKSATKHSFCYSLTQFIYTAVYNYLYNINDMGNKIRMATNFLKEIFYYEMIYNCRKNTPV